MADKSQHKKNSEAETLRAIRDGFGDGFLELGSKNPQVIGLSADLTESVRMQEFADKYPSRFLQMGIAEQNMAAVAAGLALSGFIPYIGSFAAFQPYRNLDQIRTSICIQNANVKIVSSHAGFSYGADGVQVQALEDVGIMSTLPNMQVWVPADADQAKQMALQSAEVDGAIYLRLGREKTPSLSSFGVADESELKFVPGQAQLLKTGTDVTIVTYGYIVAQAFRAAKSLESAGIYATILNVPTIKPLDVERILEAALVTKRVIVVEEHQQIGGLGAMVAQVLLQDRSKIKFGHVAVQDVFGDTAQTTAELWDAYGLSVENIVQAAKNLLA